MHFFTDSHVPGASGFLNFLTPLVKDLQILSATTFIGLLLAIAFFIREEHSRFLPEAIRIRNLAIIPAATWLISNVSEIGITSKSAN